MKYVIAVFLSRSETLSFANALRKIGIIVSVVQTPKTAGKTCGLSVKFNYDNFNTVKALFAKMSFSSFQGFFLQ